VSSDDVPSPIDFHDPAAARAWVERTERIRPHREVFFARIAAEVAAMGGPVDVVELGSGPGLLAEAVLTAATLVESYTAVDFSAAMLELSGERLEPWRGRVRFVQADLRDHSWTAGTGRADAVLSMQAVHELRHKRRAPQLYAQVRSLLHPGGVALLCDHVPGLDPDDRRRALYMTPEEQRSALLGAGFGTVVTLLELDGLVLYRADLA
jgi:SAM-dependent methyltransferase